MKCQKNNNVIQENLFDVPLKQVCLQPVSYIKQKFQNLFFKEPVVGITKSWPSDIHMAKNLFFSVGQCLTSDHNKSS